MLLVPPHRSLMFSTVSGTVDASYTNSWLVDGRAEYPVRTAGNLSLSLTKAVAQACDVFAVCIHGIRAAATINLTGDVTNTIPTATYPANAIPNNWYRKLATPVAVDALTLAVTGNTDPVIIGEFYAGLAWEPSVDLRHGRELNPGEVLARLGEFGIALPYDAGFAAPRGMRGELALTDAELVELVDFHAATRNGTRPALFIPDTTINDAWLCVFSFRSQTIGGTHFVTIEFLEIPRLRWPA